MRHCATEYPKKRPPLSADVRFTPKSRHWLSVSRCPRCAKADIMRRSKIILLDHLVSGDAQGLGHRDDECLGRFEIDGQQVFHRHLHRKLRLLGASQDIVQKAGRTAKILLEVCAIGNKTAVAGEDRWPIDRRQMVPRRQRYGCRAVVSVEGIWGDKEGTAGFAAERGNDCFNLSVAVNGRCDWRNIE